MYNKQLQSTTTFSSSLLNEIFLSIDREPHSSTTNKLSSSPAADGCRLRRLLDHDRKMSSLRRSRIVDKWIDKPNYENVTFTPIVPPPSRRRPSPSPVILPTVSSSVDEDPDSFFSTTSVSSSDSSVGGLSSTASEPETPSFDSSSKPKTSCFGPFRAPKPVKTKAKVESCNQFEEDCSTNKSSSSSRAVKIYSQLKSLKQPISPGLKLAKYINSLFLKETAASKKTKTKHTESNFQGTSRRFRGIPVPERKYKSEQTSPEWSISSSSLTKPPYSTNKLVSKKETEIPVSDQKVGSKLLMKRYEEMRIHDDEVDMNRKVLEEVALDLLNNYWNRRKEANEDDEHQDDNDKDDSSCSSSDLFEIDHLSLIENDELPVYETTSRITS